jgi:superfamily II DNA/RNA helicase
VLFEITFPITASFWKVTLKFSELDLHPSLQSAIDKLGFAEATPIQEMTMPHLLEGRDMAGLAQTGTGKTAAFLLPLMERIVRARLNPDELSDEEKAKREQRMFPDWRPNQFVLVLVPTRELADQVYENALKLVGTSNLKAVSIYGGVAYDKQKEGLRNGVEFVIATPGRLIDLYKENQVDLKQVRAIVFDEADRMFDMGFKDDMKFILQRVPKERQFLVFSATLNLDVMNTAYQFGANPVEVNVSRDQAKAENVDDKIFHVGQDEKGPHLLSLLKLHKPRQAIVFSNFKMNVPRIAQFLNDNGFPAAGISSLLTQSQRNRVMEQFKGDSDHNILVATDVAARGLDIKGVDMVVNFELPDDPENYVHRIGRTGRAGAKGIAFSLVSERDVDALSRVEQYLKHKLETGFLEEGDLVKEFKAMSSDRGPRMDRGPRPDRGGGRPEWGARPERGGGRGARPDREGGRRGEGRGDRPARAAGSPEGGPRPQAAGEGRPPRDRGGRGGGDRDQQRRPRPEGQPGQPQAQGGGGGRRDGRRGKGGDQQQLSRAQGGGPRPNGSHQGKGGPQRRDQGGRRDQGKGGQPRGQTPQASIGQKVSGFFKRLFGG